MSNRLKGAARRYGRVMARPLRPIFAGAYYHVATRGNSGMSIYRDGEDRIVFLHRPRDRGLGRDGEVAADVLEKRSVRLREIARILGEAFHRLLTCD